MAAPRHIFFCGFMGCGKSTHGKKMAGLLKYLFTDLDKYIQDKENKTIQFIFDQEGEDEFRRLETKYLQELIANNTNHVIALGGGTVCFNNNIELIKASGTLIYIEMPAKALAERLQHSRQKRPLLNVLAPGELIPFIEDKLKSRDRFYRQADIIMEGIDLNYLQLHQLLLEYKK